MAKILGGSGKNLAVSYDIYSNIHYGYVGSRVGIGRQELQVGANGGGAAGKNDNGDKLSVDVGVDLYEKYGMDLTEAELASAVDRLVDDLDAIRASQVVKFP
jgi:hypothetical protein